MARCHSWCHSRSVRGHRRFEPATVDGPTLRFMEIDVDRLARRAEGFRLLLYLDQSTLSALVKEGSHSDLLDLLRAEVNAGRLLCPTSISHEDETARIHVRDPGLWREIDGLADELSIGIGFRGEEEIEFAEIYAAAAAFEDHEDSPIWKEAFRTDPNTPRDELFSDFGRVRVYFEPSETLHEEVAHERAKEAGMDGAYAELREKGFSFEEMAEGNLEQMISWKLGPVLAPEEFRNHYLQRGVALAQETDAGEFDIAPGSAYNRFMAFGTRRLQMERLVERHPEITRKPSEFRRFEPLRSLPTLAFPALFRAALAARSGRRARLSDGHDIAHLTHGLSRCHLVTADAGMTQLIKDFKLAPAGCQVFSYREFDQLAATIQELLAEGWTGVRAL